MHTIDDANYYLACWFLSSKDGRDYQAIAYRRPDEDFFRLDYRFRYYADPDEKDGFDPFDARDQKNFWQAKISADKTEDQIIKDVDGAIDSLVREGWCGTRLPWKVREHRFKTIVRATGEKFREIFLGLPYVHYRQATEDDMRGTDAEASIPDAKN